MAVKCMASGFFALQKTTLQQAFPKKTNCCNNAVPLLNEAKTRTFRSITNLKKVRIYLDFVYQLASLP